MAEKNYSFVEVEYTGRLADGSVFDTTDEKIAKDSGLFREKSKYGPVVVCLGAGHLVKGLEDELKGKGAGTFVVSLSADKAFGRKDVRLVQLVPMKKLADSNIRPFPGLQLNIDGALATVKAVSGGRVMVDFNHPLAGRDVVYEVKIIRGVSDDAEKAKAVFELEAGMSVKVEKKGGGLIVKGVKKEFWDVVKKRLSEFIDTNIVFEEDKSS
jgi:FKBP-type peptidyl-prolyl cis-trans isomerase SlyD